MDTCLHGFICTGGVISVTDTVAGNKHGDPSSNRRRDWLNFTVLILLRKLIN